MVALGHAGKYLDIIRLIHNQCHRIGAGRLTGLAADLRYFRGNFHPRQRIEGDADVGDEVGVANQAFRDGREIVQGFFADVVEKVELSDLREPVRAAAPTGVRSTSPRSVDHACRWVAPTLSSIARARHDGPGRK